MNYPHFSTVKRMYGVDKDEITRRYTEILEDHSETFELSEAAGLMFDFVNEFRNVGHLIFYNGAAYEQVGNMLKGFSSQDESIKHLYDTFTGKNTVRSYEYLRKNDIPFNNDRVQTQNKSEEISSEVEGYVEINKNISYKIFDDNIVYLNINSFDNSLINDDHEELIKFFDQISGYDNLIIDITNNGGGSDYYWMQNIIAPNITTTLTWNNYGLTKSLGIYHSYARNKEVNRESELYQTISNLPEITDEVLSEFDIALTTPYKVDPAGTYKLFNGSIYLLVGAKVYSASEDFAMFCKNTKFATLVGSNTGGDGGGLTIQDFALTNTGLLVRFATKYPLNSDGTSNTEYGTIPDFYTDDNQSALEACFLIINSSEP